jgi:small-conductance mechanosensitive channel
MNREQVRETESRWAVPAAASAFLAGILMILPNFVSSVSGDGNAELLRSVDANSGNVMLTGLMQAGAFLFALLPLACLFRAARARSERVLSPLIVLVVIAPLLVAAGTLIFGQARQEAADTFIAGEAKPTISAKEVKEECQGEKPLAACERGEREDDAASDAISDASLTPLATILSLGGALLFAISLFYTCLWAMRTGLLTRFWGSLGMALGIAFLIGFFILGVVWFIYLGLLYLGLLPGGKPPAWEAGEAVAWPTPGEKAAAELEPVEAGSPGEGTTGDGERRKRKRRE